MRCSKMMSGCLLHCQRVQTSRKPSNRKGRACKAAPQKLPFRFLVTAECSIACLLHSVVEISVIRKYRQQQQCIPG